MSNPITKAVVASWDRSQLHVVEFLKQFGVDEDPHGFRYVKGTTGIVFEFNHWIGSDSAPEWHIMLGGGSLYIEKFVEYSYLGLVDTDPLLHKSFVDLNQRISRKVDGLIQGIKYHGDALNLGILALRKFMEGGLEAFPDALTQIDALHWNTSNLLPWNIIQSRISEQTKNIVEEDQDNGK